MPARGAVDEQQLAAPAVAPVDVADVEDTTQPDTLPEQGPERPRRVVTIKRAPAEPAYAPPPSQPAPAAGRSGCFWMLVAIFGILLVFILGIVGVVLAGVTTLGNITNGFEAMFIPREPVVNVTRENE